ncbi:glycosyltransferase family A protein [uncultured Shewanella sp.]|uniref:glycosyltransferase family 2 protein n=1 Tax=uncultured Shewanella sp. TaxID=173975 RepID=UPI0026114964|nr:glycosyltransferase family A protein [uncultured Shewanella sp.]
MLDILRLYAIRIYIKSITKRGTKSTFIDNLNLDKEISYNSLIFWLFKYHSKHRNTENIYKVISIYLKSNYANIEENSISLDFLINSRKNEAKELLIKKIDGGFKYNTLNKHYTFLKEENLIKYLDYDCLIKLSKNNEIDLSILYDNIIENKKINKKIIISIVKTLITNQDYINSKIFLDKIKNIQLKGKPFYYVITLMINFCSETELKNFIKQQEKSYIYRKNNLYEYIHKKSLLYNDGFLSNITSKYVKPNITYHKKRMEAIAKSNLKLNEFVYLFKNTNFPNLDISFTKIFNSNTLTKKKFYDKNKKYYPYICSYLLESIPGSELYCFKESNTINHLLARETNLLKKFKNSKKISFNIETYKRMLEEGDPEHYLMICSDSSEKALIEFQKNKKNGNFKNALIHAKYLRDHTQDRERKRNILRVIEMYDKLGEEKKVKKELRRLKEGYLKANILIINNNIDKPVAERLKKLDKYNYLIENKSDDLIFIKTKLSLLVEENENKKIKKYIDEVIKNKEQYIYDPELKKLIILTLYFILNDKKDIIKLSEKYKTADKTTLIYESLIKIEQNIEIPDEIYKSIDPDLKLIKLNNYIHKDLKSKSIQTFQETINSKVVSKEYPITIKNIKLSSNFKGKEINSNKLISIIMTNYGYSDYVEVSIKSILEQSYSNFELIIIDDKSDSLSYYKLNSLIERINDPRITLIQSKENGGTYKSKNIGMSIAKGELITFQDSDDYSHPDRLVIQKNNIEENNKIANTVKCFRLTQKGTAYFYRSGAIKKAPISLMIKRKVFNELGYFNSVRVGSDSEYLSRIKLVYGNDAIINLDYIGYFASYQLTSLTSLGKTSLHPVLGITGIRAKYKKTYLKWHAEIRQGRTPYLPRNIEISI